MVLGYFGAALAIDLVFQGGSFCKYLCPIGQFNFTASTLSPLEVTIRNRSVCGACRTSDCIKGRRAAVAPAVVLQRGCELGLFLPSKVGNLDCTFCLDCVQACPHDNVAIAARLPGAELVDGGRRSGIGRLATRPDIAALAVLFAFGGVLNAFAMTGPVYDLERWLARSLGVTSEWPVLVLLFVASLVVIPALALGAASLATKTLTGAGSVRKGIVHYAAALVPFGFGVWLAHYGFHLLTGMLTIVPVVQSAAIDALGWAALGDPLWRLTGMRPGAVFPIQLGFLLLGTMGAIAVAYGISEREHPARAGAATVPWALVIVAMATAAIWVLGQPMEMRAVELAG